MWLDYLGNAVIYYLQKLPFVGRNVPRAWYRQKKTVHIWGAVGAVCVFLWELFKRALAVGLFIWLPRFLFMKYSATKETGFGLDNCYTYFSLVMICYAGSLLRSQIFKVNEFSVTCLKTVKVDPAAFFRTRLLVSGCLDFACYWLLLTCFGMTWYKSFYIALLIMVSRFVGETIQLLTFHITDKRLMDLKGVNIFVMLSALFAAYFMPYIRECVPSANRWIFQTVTFAVIMILCAFFIYYVWNYDNYRLVATRIHTYHYLMREMGEGPEKEEPVSAEAVSDFEHQAVKALPKFNVHGYRYLNWLFLNRNRGYLVKQIGARLVVVVIALFIALITNLLGHGDVTYKVIVSSIPVMAFVMYAMSLGDGLCRTMFSQCDRYLLHYGYYRRTEDVMEHFVIRLRMLCVLNLLPALALVAAYIIAGVASGVEEAGLGVFYSCMEILAMSLIFSVVQLGEYYLLQPYNEQVEAKNPFFVLMQVLLLILGYGCIFIDVLPLHFLLGTVLVLALLLSGCFTLIWRFAPRTFRICRK